MRELHRHSFRVGVTKGRNDASCMNLAANKEQKRRKGACERE